MTATVPTDGGPSNVRMTPAAIDALHKLARPQAESVARAIAAIGQVAGKPVEAPNGNGNGRQYLAAVPDDEKAPVVMYRLSEDKGYLVTALVDRDTYQTYEIAEQPSFLRSNTFRAAVGAVAAAAIGIILGSRTGRPGLSVLPDAGAADLADPALSFSSVPPALQWERHEPAAICHQEQARRGWAG